MSSRQEFETRLNWEVWSEKVNKILEEIVEDATIEDLDEEAIKRARELFSKRQSDRKKAQEVLKKLSDIEVLNKAGITIKGKIVWKR